MKEVSQKKHQTLVSFFVGLMSIGLFLIVNLFFHYETESINSMFFHALVLITFIFTFIIWNSYFSESIVDPINLLLYAQFIFLGSNSLLKILSIDSKDFFVGYTLTSNDYNMTNALIILGILFFLLGAIIGKIKKTYIRDTIRKVYFRNSYFDKSSIFILIVGIIALLLDFDKTWLIASYREFGPTTIWKIIWSTFLPVSGFVLMSSEKKKLIKVGFWVLLLLSFLYIMMGNRGYSISLLLVLLWLYNNSVKKISKKKFIVISLVIISVSSVFFQMKSLTLVEKLDVYRFVDMDSTSPIISTLQEGSVTYRTLIYTVKHIPDMKNFQLGSSYFWAFTTIFPNVFGTPIHPSLYFYEGPSEWLRWNFAPLQANIGQGFGFSMIGEAYYNFGVFGVSVVLFLLGYSISKLSIKSQIINNRFNTIMLSILFSNIIWGIRNPASSIMRDIAWQLLVVFIVTSFIKLVSKSKT